MIEQRNPMLVRVLKQTIWQQQDRIQQATERIRTDGLEREAADTAMLAAVYADSIRRQEERIRNAEADIHRCRLELLQMGEELPLGD